MNTIELQLLGIEMLGLACLVLGLFWLRRRITIIPLYVSLGVFQPVQLILTSSIYVDLWPGLSVSPGTLMFAASLLAVLVVYIREDAAEARKVVYGILGANLAMTLIFWAVSFQIRTNGTHNLLGVAPQVFSQGARVTVVGTIVLVADVMLLLLFYNAGRRFLQRSPFLRIWSTLAGVLAFDAVAFTTGAFVERSDYLPLLSAAVLSKLGIATFFAVALTAYLRLVEPGEAVGPGPNHPLRDLFYSFTFRDKFELQSQQTHEVEAQLERAQRVAHLGFLDWDTGSDRIYWSDEMVRLIGLPPGSNEQTMQSTIAHVHPDDRDAVRASLRHAISGGWPHRLDHRMLRADGSVMWVQAEGELAQDREGSGPRFIGTLVDITERKQQEEEREQIFDRITDAFVALDRNWVYTYVNAKAGDIFGRTARDLIGKNIWIEFPEAIGQSFDLAYRQAMAEQKPLHLESYYGPYGRWFENWIYPSPDGLTIYFRDITERVELQKELVRRATRDELTGLPNRQAMREAVDTLLGEGPDRVGIIALNIDRLHHVNDTLGYGAGDQVLVEAGRRLVRFAAAARCSVGRIGGDEFLLTTEPGADPASFESVANQAAHLLGQPYAVGADQEVYLTCSAGVSWFPDAGRSAAELLGQADLALNVAKQRGRNQVVLYSRERATDLADRVALTTAMRQGLEQHEFHLHYQPLVDAATGVISGAEALMRWNNARLGSPAPNRFIPIAEDTGVIIPLGNWALRSAIAAQRRWPTPAANAIPISVNVSAVQFQRAEFAEEIEEALRAGGMAPQLLKLEVTESVLMADMHAAAAMLKRLKQVGVRISLDDFGTGYSSLGYLRHLPIDEIKIDGSFVRDISVDKHAATLCRAIIAMSQQLSFTVVAEGVETAAQAEFLRNAGCHQLQGFLFSKPVPAREFAAMLEAGSAHLSRLQR